MTLEPFTYGQPSVRVLFGAGSVGRVREELQRSGARRPFVLSSPGRRAAAEEIARCLQGLTVAIHAEARMHVPIEIAATARRAATLHEADWLVAIGGGSTIGLAKAIALEQATPILAIPTTYSGSEMTAIYGLTEGGAKRTGRDPRVQPRVVLYDPALTLGLPAEVSGPSGMNAVAHCLEALYAPDKNPVSTWQAGEGLRALAGALPQIVRAPDNLEVRTTALYGAWLAGSALGSTTTGLHHKLCHVLGGTFNLPHAEVHTVILPHAAAFNRDAAPDAMRIAAEAFGVSDAAAGFYDLGARLGVPMTLKALGMPREGLDRAATIVAGTSFRNPRPIDEGSVRQLLENAYDGIRPT